MTGLQAIKYQRGRLEVLDQLKLPHEFVYDEVSTCEEAFDCIKSMRVRGMVIEIASNWLEWLSNNQEPQLLQSWRH